MKALILTKRTKPPQLFTDMRKAAKFEVDIEDPNENNFEELSGLLTRSNPDIILVDGYYAPGDRKKFEKLSKKVSYYIGVELADISKAAQWPASIRLVVALRAVRKKLIPIVFFIDDPVLDLRVHLWLKADIVWGSLDEPGDVEESFLKLVTKGRSFVREFVSLAKNLADRR